MATPLTLRLVDPQPEASPFASSVVTLPESPPDISTEDGALKIGHPDGSVTVKFGATREKPPADENDFDRNVADEIDSEQLARFASDLLTGIEYDDLNRREWLETRRRGIELLGLKLEEPRGDVGASSAPLEGMSTIRHPLLLEATIRFQATARGELLPAAGPVKVRNDAPMPPDNLPPPMGHNGGPPIEPNGSALDDLGSALEKDMNHYLTVTATEYIPDTDRMLFYIGFGGDGFKKVYNCPLRRRPVSESVDAENIIVSNAATDIRNCGRVTHQIKMRPSILKRMQIVGAYRDITIPLPSLTKPKDPVEKQKEEISGVKTQPLRSEDADYTIYECYCELDIDEFAPKKFRGKALPLPYVVTIEKDSRQVLAVRRNWEEDDEQCLAKQFFVQFPFIRGLGFYGLGLVHILGNVTRTLTAIWREFVDAGMFANFPGMLHMKALGRQSTNQIRVPPGGSQGIDIPPGVARIQDAVMALPFKEPGAAFTAFATHVEEVGQRLGQTADISIGEGKQDMPVGTTMALIEQATKIMDSVHKRMHAAQAEEFGLLKERFREDPEAFWRHNKKPAREWTVKQFKQALEQRDLVPVADPNNPTSLHRIAKAVILDTMMSKYQQNHNIPAGIRRIYRIAGIDVDGILNAQPSPAPPDPRFTAIQAKAQAQAQIAQIQQFQAVLKARQMEMDAQGKAEDRASRERIEQMKLYLEQMRVEQEAIIHAHDIKNSAEESRQSMAADSARAVHQFAMDHVQHHQDLAMERDRHAHQMQVENIRTGNQLHAEQQRHDQQMRHAEQKHDVDLEHKKAMARVAKPKAGEK